MKKEEKRGFFNGIPKNVKISTSRNSEGTCDYAEITTFANDQELKVHFVKSVKSKVYTVSKVIDISSGNVIWSYKAEGFDGYCYLYEARNMFIIGFVKDWTLQRIFPLPDLHKKRVNIKGSIFYEGQDFAAIVKLKKYVAEKYRLKYELTETEKGILALSDEAEKIKKEEVLKRRKEHYKEVFSRSRIFAWYGSEKRYSGIPVEAGSNDWECLGDGQWVIMVSSYNVVTKEVGGLILVGVVDAQKKGHKKLKIVRSEGLTKGRPVLDKTTEEKQVSLGIFKMKKSRDLMNLLIVDREDFNQKVYPNSGTAFAVKEKKKEYTVYKTKAEGGLDTVGLATIVAEV